MDLALDQRSAQLRTSRIPFVHARVVLAERPTSAKPGDEAIVLGDGTIEGFVGGECAESTVRERSLAALRSGESALLRITPDAEADQPGKVVVHNPCLSGGTLEIFLEPEVPAPLVVVAGSAPIAQALVELGERLGYDLRPHDGTLPEDTSAVVVASHGRDEEAVLSAALRAGVPYVGLVASPRRGSAVVASLDVPDELRAKVRTPAGLDIGAHTPGEVALSILAELIARRPRPQTPGPSPLPMVQDATATDPVCGMSVPMVEASLHLEVDGRTWWFCGSGCQRAFAADPAAFGA
ncbi:XdhC family protein [Egicoccus sp. AB-alg2]|uniref:XdhC family protein n=1 Tax=Egicoccus sp. AB-alg2 TaxID=3242693 RepID=UPI00359CBE3B